jgi:hypothetical protein
MKFYIEQVVRAGTRNAVVLLDNGALLKIDIDKAKAGTWLEFEGSEDVWIHSIDSQIFRKVKKGDKSPKMLGSYIY